MYAWGNRDDCTVVDEPLYAHYLRVSEAEHPGREEIMASQSRYAEEVVKEVIFGPYDSRIALFKQMTHHLVDLDRRFLLDTKNVLLIRNPEEIIASYSKVIPKVLMRDIGIEMQTDLLAFLEDNGQPPAIVDAKELLLDPEGVLRQLCIILDVPFSNRMLSWEKGARKEDGVWAKYWYTNVHKSQGFQKYRPREIHLEGDLKKLADECRPHYDALFKKCLKAHA